MVFWCPNSENVLRHWESALNGPWISQKCAPPTSWIINIRQLQITEANGTPLKCECKQQWLSPWHVTPRLIACTVCCNWGMVGDWKDCPERTMRRRSMRMVTIRWPLYPNETTFQWEKIFSKVPRQTERTLNRPTNHLLAVSSSLILQLNLYRRLAFLHTTHSRTYNIIWGVLVAFQLTQIH